MSRGRWGDRLGLLSLIFIVPAVASFLVGAVGSGVTPLYLSMVFSVLAGATLALAVKLGSRPTQAPDTLPPLAMDEAADDSFSGVDSMPAWRAWAGDEGGGDRWDWEEPSEELPAVRGDAEQWAAEEAREPTGGRELPEADEPAELAPEAAELPARGRGKGVVRIVGTRRRREAPPVRSGGEEEPADLPIKGYAELNAREVISVLGLLDASELRRVRDHEASHRARTTVLRRIDRRLESTAVND
jgi:hypothetical protein